MTAESIPIGCTGTASCEVKEDNLARSVGSGDVNVFSTPSLVSLAEQASVNAIRPFLTDGETTVGTFVGLHHVAPTPPGCGIKATSRLIAREGRKLVFDVNVHDDLEKVGYGTHERFLVTKQDFTEKAYRKLSKQKKDNRHT